MLSSNILIWFMFSKFNTLYDDKLINIICMCMLVAMSEVRLQAEEEVVRGSNSLYILKFRYRLM